MKPRQDALRKSRRKVPQSPQPETMRCTGKVLRGDEIVVAQTRVHLRMPRVNDAANHWRGEFTSPRADQFKLGDLYRLSLDDLGFLDVVVCRVKGEGTVAFTGVDRTKLDQT